MTPTRRLLLLFLLTVPVAAVEGIGRTLAASLALLIALVALLDWRLARDIRRVTVTREVEIKLSLAEWNPVTLTLASTTGRALNTSIRDVVPTDFGVDESAAPHVTSTGASLVVPPGSTASVTYRVRPRHRGNFAFGDMYVNAPGPLGLVRRSHTVAASALPVRVYPSLRGLRRYELLVRRGLALEAGTKAIRVPGASTEFERLREYGPDDEFRRINWKATARRGKPIVNLFEAERSQNVVIMLDCGRLMGARAETSQESRTTQPGTWSSKRNPPAQSGDGRAATVNGQGSSSAGETESDGAGALLEGDATAGQIGLEKLDHAVNAAMLLAYVAGLRGDRVSLLAYADEVRAFTPPARGRRAFLGVVDALYALRSELVEPDHARAFQFLAGRNLRRSLVVLFTDLSDRESSAVLVANLLRAAHHLVVCVTLGDPTISRPALLAPDSTQALFEKMVAQRLLDERAAVLATLTQRGVHSLDTDADRLSPGLINAYLELKERARI